MAGPDERRQALRFPITLPVELERGAGITRNMSISGVSIETDRAFSTGDPIRFTLLLEPACPGVPIRLHCQGQIVRAKRQKEKVEVAVSLNAYWFEKLGGGGELK